MNFKRLEDAPQTAKRALIRVDFNVPRTDTGDISDDTRLKAALPTIKALLKRNMQVILLSHFGRPKGQTVPELSLEFIIPTLTQYLGVDVAFCDSLDAQALPDTSVILLENIRFHPGETTGDPQFAQALAALGDIYIQDAFSAAHRNHASSAGIAAFRPAFAGLAMERELDHLSQALGVPRPPVMGVVGGAKVSTKIDLLNNLVTQLDMLVIGGGMANTFLAAQGHAVGKSLCEHDLKDTALTILDRAQTAGCEIILPVDGIAAKAFAAHAPHRVCTLEDVGPDEMILDAGPASIEHFMDAVDRAKTVIWNGPLGAFEIPPFDTSTVEAAQYVAQCVKTRSLIAVAGGGDTVAALKHAGASDGFTFISTAGGAFLEWMEGKPLPGVDILKT